MKKIIFVIMLLSGLSGYANAGEILIIAGEKFPQNEISMAQVKDIFLGRSVLINGGQEVVPLERKSEDKLLLKNNFSEKVLEKSPTRLKAYWSEQIFTGRGYPPKVLDDFASLKKALDEDPLALSYADPSEPVQGMKIVLRVHL